MDEFMRPITFSRQKVTGKCCPGIVSSSIFNQIFTSSFLTSIVQLGSCTALFLPLQGEVRGGMGCLKGKLSGKPHPHLDPTLEGEGICPASVALIP
jgi:hypothetical protein